MASAYNQSDGGRFGDTNIVGHEKCDSYFLFRGETTLGEGFRTFLYFLGLAYCFIGLSAITARFFRSMENVVKQSRKVVEIDPNTNAEVIRYEKVWNYAIADISLLAFGTSFPQISLATIDAIQNIGNLYAGGMGPGTLVGSAAFDLFPIHAVCVVVPKAGELKKIADIGVWLVELFWSFWAYIWLYIILEVWTPNVITLWEALLTVLQYGLLLMHAYAQDKRWPYLSLPIPRTERPEEWVPGEVPSPMHENNVYGEYSDSEIIQVGEENRNVVDIFSIHSNNGTGPVYQKVPVTDDAAESSNKHFHQEKDLHVLSLWKEQFVDALTESFGYFLYLGINAYVIAFTALASGTSWPDLVASKIAAERQTTADSAIANITCRFFIAVLNLGLSYIIFGHFQIPKCFHHNVSYSKRDSGEPHWFEYYSWRTRAKSSISLKLFKQINSGEMFSEMIILLGITSGKFERLYCCSRAQAFDTESRTWGTKDLGMDVRPQGALSTEESCSKAKKDHLTTALEASTSRE
ncbi:hypothetical protein POTOM_048385 [Populus tomentosa]|uniref:Sodium/calcium exchanger membrane region domain-containing protein n=1 Tax=Populus tomentosa TaxID=118781 RepID=A0A8X8CBT8_POPTO|nr:hypothetical protein POTOM_048385 [Populus tomentosa]